MLVRMAMHIQSCTRCVKKSSGIKKRETGFIARRERTSQASRSEENANMEWVKKLVDGKKKVDQRKKELVLKLRRINEFLDIPPNVGDVFKIAVCASSAFLHITMQGMKEFEIKVNRRSHDIVIDHKANLFRLRYACLH